MQIIGLEELTEFSPRKSVRAQKNSLSSVYEADYPLEAPERPKIKVTRK